MSLQEADAPLLPSTPRHLADARPAPRFRTPCRRRGMLALVFCLSCLAGGPVTSWPTFEPMLGELGVLGSTRNHSSAALTEAYNLGQGIVLSVGLPMGLLYDVLGPSAVTALGGVCSGGGLALMALSISAPRFNALLFFAYPLAVAGGGLVTYSLLGFLWLFPAQQSFVGSLNTASLAISDALARGFAPSTVDLSNNLIGPAGAIAIVRAAWRRDRRTPSSVTLNLSANQIDDAAVGAIADLAARELDGGDRGDSGVDLDGGGAGHSQLAVGDNNLSAAAVARAAALLAAVSIHLVA